MSALKNYRKKHGLVGVIGHVLNNNYNDITVSILKDDVLIDTIRLDGHCEFQLDQPCTLTFQCDFSEISHNVAPGDMIYLSVDETTNELIIIPEEEINSKSNKVILLMVLALVLGVILGIAGVPKVVIFIVLILLYGIQRLFKKE